MAIPHPARVMVERNIVAAAILDKPVKWFRNQVQLVVLVALTNSMEEKVQKFYEITSRVLLSPDKVGRSSGADGMRPFSRCFLRQSEDPSLPGPDRHKFTGSAAVITSMEVAGGFW